MDSDKEDDDRELISTLRQVNGVLLCALSACKDYVERPVLDALLATTTLINSAMDRVNREIASDTPARGGLALFASFTSPRVEIVWPVVLTAAAWAMVETWHYGWDLVIRSDGEMICDGIAVLILVAAIRRRSPAR